MRLTALTFVIKNNSFIINEYIKLILRAECEAFVIIIILILIGNAY